MRTGNIVKDCRYSFVERVVKSGKKDRVITMSARRMCAMLQGKANKRITTMGSRQSRLDEDSFRHTI